MPKPRTATLELDASALADRQLLLDRARTRKLAFLFRRKLERMRASPLALLRGAAPLFYELLADHPELAEGPGGDGWLCGDMHLENFGAYRPDPRGFVAKKKDVAVFDLNDFDDAVIGPWRLDVLRLVTSLLLAGRELGADGVLALDLADRLLAAWARAAFDGAKLPPKPTPVRALVEQVRARSPGQLLDARTELVRGRRRFTRGKRYGELSRHVAASVPSAFAAYIASLPGTDRPPQGELEIEDAALRIAGTGSLGGLRIAVLVRGSGGKDGQHIFDLKEQGTPSAAPLLRVPKGLAPAERVATAFRAAVARPPRMIGTTQLLGISMLARKLTPQEDRLDYSRLANADLPAVATYLGALLGSAHARGATRMPRVPWSRSDLSLLRAHAIALAGAHEALYLALCDRIRKLLPDAA